MRFVEEEGRRRRRGICYAFMIADFLNVAWLYGFSRLNKLFCWAISCILQIFNDLNNLQQTEKRHQTTVAHTISFKDFKFSERIK
jgi:hypothetical protein